MSNDEQTKANVSYDAEVTKLKLEIQKLSLEILTGQEKNTSKLKALKKEVARLLTKKNSSN